MKLETLLKSIKVLNIAGSTEHEITGVNIDSRKVENGHMFIAMRGTQVDGHAYIGKAIESGAKAVLCEEIPSDINDDITYIQVESCEDSVGKIASVFYGEPSRKLKLVGVTGTNGKTTIATLLYNM
ncbi:MAG: Mur ligase domain-containing protein, partial [Prevotella sp.]|nr:Mur ligase domain-containing protein [Prevotella sp.]